MNLTSSHLHIDRELIIKSLYILRAIYSIFPSSTKIKLVRQ